MQSSSIFYGFTTTTLQQMISVKLLNTQARSVLDILKILWAAFPYTFLQWLSTLIRLCFIKKIGFCTGTTLSSFPYHFNFITYHTSSQPLSAFDGKMSLKHESIITTLKASLLLLYPINIYSVVLKYL